MKTIFFIIAFSLLSTYAFAGDEHADRDTSPFTQYELDDPDMISPGLDKDIFIFTTVDNDAQEKPGSCSQCADVEAEADEAHSIQ